MRAYVISLLRVAQAGLLASQASLSLAMHRFSVVPMAVNTKLQGVGFQRVGFPQDRADLWVLSSKSTSKQSLLVFM